MNRGETVIPSKSLHGSLDRLYQLLQKKDFLAGNIKIVENCSCYVGYGESIKEMVGAFFAAF